MDTNGNNSSEVWNHKCQKKTVALCQMVAASKERPSQTWYNKTCSATQKELAAGADFHHIVKYFTVSPSHCANHRPITTSPHISPHLHIAHHICTYLQISPDISTTLGFGATVKLLQSGLLLLQTQAQLWYWFLAVSPLRLVCLSDWDHDCALRLFDKIFALRVDGQWMIRLHTSSMRFCQLSVWSCGHGTLPHCTHCTWNSFFCKSHRRLKFFYKSFGHKKSQSLQWSICPRRRMQPNKCLKGISKKRMARVCDVFLFSLAFWKWFAGWVSECHI